MQLLLAQSKTQFCTKKSAGKGGMLFQALGLTSVVMLALMVSASAQIQTRAHKPNPGLTHPKSGRGAM